MQCLCFEKQSPRTDYMACSSSGIACCTVWRSVFIRSHLVVYWHTAVGSVTSRWASGWTGLVVRSNGLSCVFTSSSSIHAALPMSLLSWSELSEDVEGEQSDWTVFVFVEPTPDVIIVDESNGLDVKLGNVTNVFDNGMICWDWFVPHLALVSPKIPFGANVRMALAVGGGLLSQGMTFGSWSVTTVGSFLICIVPGAGWKVVAMIAFLLLFGQLLKCPCVLMCLRRELGSVYRFPQPGALHI